MDQVDEIRRKFGSLDELKSKMDIAKLKEEKVSELLGQLDHSMVR